MRKTGFTLVELMIAVAILAIVAAVALPLYNQYSIRTYRTEAQADLLNCAQGMERYAAQNFNYDGADAAFLAGTICNPRSDDQGRYNITVVVPDDNQFTLTATPVGGSVVGDGIMTYNQAGVRAWDRDENGIDPDEQTWDE
jgi:type IV pilus assembly protein PilE